MQLFNLNECEEFLRTNCYRHGTIREKERCYALYFDRSGKQIYCEEIGCGGYKGVTIDVRGMVKIAMFLHTDHIVIAHNHPTGIVEPSIDDLAVAKKLEVALSFLDIEMVDFLILTHEDFFSLKNNGLLGLKQDG